LAKLDGELNPLVKPLRDEVKQGSAKSLLEGFASGNRASLQELYQMNFTSVANYVIKNSGTESDARDVYQDAITAAWINVREGRYQARDDASLGGYIFQIARHKWLDRLKSKPRKATLYIEETPISDEPEVADYASDEKLEHLKTLYAQLNDSCKAILNRFYYEKKSLEEIGAELGFDAGSVKTMKYRCMKKLRTFHFEEKQKNA
jgi:RNA polymerase sigma factor (sigma-70 family)